MAKPVTGAGGIVIVLVITQAPLVEDENKDEERGRSAAAED